MFQIFHFFQRSRGGSATERNDEKSWQVSLFFITFVNVLKIIKLQFQDFFFYILNVNVMLSQSEAFIGLISLCICCDNNIKR